MNAPVNAGDAGRAAGRRAPIEGWDQACWTDAPSRCPRCGHDGPLETAALRWRAAGGEDHDELVDELVDELLVGAVDEIRPGQETADRDALLAAYAALLHEWAAIVLSSLPEGEIRERLADMLRATVPPAVVADCRSELNRLRARCEALGIAPASFRAPTRERARRAA